MFIGVEPTLLLLLYYSADLALSLDTLPPFLPPHTPLIYRQRFYYTLIPTFFTFVEIKDLIYISKWPYIIISIYLSLNYCAVLPLHTHSQDIWSASTHYSLHPFLFPPTPPIYLYILPPILYLHKFLYLEHPWKMIQAYLYKLLLFCILHLFYFT